VVEPNEEYVQKAIRIPSIRLDSADDYEDLAQHIRIKASQQDGPKPIGWYITVAKNKAVDTVRKQRCRIEINAGLYNASDVNTSSFGEMHRVWDTAAKRFQELQIGETPMEDHDAREVMRAAIGKLNGPDQIIAKIQLSDVSYQDAANALGISLSAYKCRVHRMRKKLAKILGMVT
jgi:RNA polymerase sigma factor (sigma-70 family)